METSLESVSIVHLACLGNPGLKCRLPQGTVHFLSAVGMISNSSLWDRTFRSEKVLYEFEKGYEFFVVILQACWGTPSFHSLWAGNLLPRANYLSKHSHRSLTLSSRSSHRSAHMTDSRHHLCVHTFSFQWGIISPYHFWKSYLSPMFHLNLSLLWEFLKLPLLGSHFFLLWTPIGLVVYTVHYILTIYKNTSLAWSLPFPSSWKQHSVFKSGCVFLLSRCVSETSTQSLSELSKSTHSQLPNGYLRGIRASAQSPFLPHNLHLGVESRLPV